MFGPKYKRLDGAVEVRHHFGFIKEKIGLFEGVAFIISGTVGAGILGLPYAVSKVGPLLGVFCIVILGLLMMGLNLMLGEVSIRTQNNLQLVGLAEKYLGKFGKFFMSLMMYSALVGILEVYIIGEGEALAALFGGLPVLWSMLFFVVAAVFIFRGLKSFKIFDFFLTVGILAVVIIIALACVPHIKLNNLLYFNFSNLMFPYGVILFAFASTGAVVEAHGILRNSEVNFKRAIIIASLACVVIYSAFAVAVLGVTGSQTTEIVTVGLVSNVGRSFFILGNLFAALAMATSFLVHGLSFKHSLSWDYKIPRTVSAGLVCFIPLLIFTLGLRSFIMVIDIVGGVFISLTMLLLIFIYWRAKQLGDIKPSKYHLDHIYLLAGVLVLAFTIGVVNSVVGLF